MKNDSSLFYACGLIEHIGRTRKARRGFVVERLGTERLLRIYKYADVLHSDSIDHVADEYSEMSGITEGNYDNVAACRYDVPDRWAIASVFARLVEDVMGDGDDSAEAVVATLQQVYSSWIADAIGNYNTDFFYQSRSYILACYEDGKVLE